MSLSQQAHDLQYSFNSLYTPSYSIAGLLPLDGSPEDFASRKPTSRKSSEHASTSPSDESLEHKSSSRDKSEVLCSSSPLETKQTEAAAPHYQKLKMNYFRKLNLGTISSETDVAQKSPRTGKTDKSPPSTHTSTTKFIPSFNPNPNRSSQPIKIPTSTKSSKPSRGFEEESPRESKKKVQISFSLKKEDSLDLSGVFDAEFEL